MFTMLLPDLVVNTYLLDEGELPSEIDELYFAKKNQYIRKLPADQVPTIVCQDLLDQMTPKGLTVYKLFTSHEFAFDFMDQSTFQFNNFSKQATGNATLVTPMLLNRDADSEKMFCENTEGSQKLAAFYKTHPLFQSTTQSAYLRG